MAKKQGAKGGRSIYVILVGTAVVLFWRGVWGLLDLFFFPQDHFLSFSASLVIGLVILVLTHHLSDELM